MVGGCVRSWVGSFVLFILLFELFNIPTIHRDASVGEGKTPTGELCAVFVILFQFV